MSMDDLFEDYPKIGDGYITYASRLNHEDFPEDLSTDKQKKLVLLKRRIFTKQDVENIRAKILEGESVTIIAAMYKTTVSKINSLQKRNFRPSKYKKR